MNAKEAYELKFNKKIDLLKDHIKYSEIRERADECLMRHTEPTGYAIAAIDFIDRVVVMPIAYIRDWADGKNSLEWTDEFLRIRNAMNDDECLRLQRLYPDKDVHKINISNLSFYTEYLGFTVLRQDNNVCYVM